MSNKLKVYITIIITFGFIFFLYTLNNVQNVDIIGILVFAVLSTISESLLVPASDERGLSVGFLVSLSAILVFDASAAAWITSIGIMLRVMKKEEKLYCIFNFPIYKTLFNGANIALSTGLAALCYVSLGATPGAIKLDLSLLAIIICIIVYILVNSIIMSILMHLLNGGNFLLNYYKNVVWVIKDYFAMAPLSIIMAIAYINYGIIGVLLFFGPLLFARNTLKMYIDMRNIYIDTVKSLSQAVEAKDPYTNGHSQRVGEYACELAEKLGMQPKRIENLRIAAVLHDIGKIGVYENILNKPGKLTDEEFNRIKQHPEIGVKIIKDIDFLKDVSKIILSHHERYDGTGYPEGRKCEETVLESQILSIADVFDALTSERPYRSAMTIEEALEVIEAGKGSQFDNKLADSFIEMINENRGLTRVAG